MSRIGHLSSGMRPRARQALCEEIEFQMLLGTVENKVWEFGPQALANTLWALGRLGHFPDGPFLPILAERALWCLNGFKPQELANMVYGLAGMAPAAPPTRRKGHQLNWGSADNGAITELLNAIGEQAISCLSEFKNQELCSLVWGLGSMDFYHPYLMPAASTHILQVASKFNAQDVSNVAWACSALRYYNKELLNTLADRAVDSIDQFSPQDISSTLVSFARLGFYQEEAVNEMVAATVNNPLAFTQQQLCNTLWALAVLRVLDEGTAQHLVSAAEQGGMKGLAGTERCGSRDGLGLNSIDCAQLCHAAMVLELDLYERAQCYGQSVEYSEDGNVGEGSYKGKEENEDEQENEEEDGINVQEAMGISPLLWEAMLGAHHDVLQREVATVSAMQEETSKLLHCLGVPHDTNLLTDDSMICIGLAITDNGAQIAVEAETTYQYAINGDHIALGERQARWALLEARGWLVVVIPAHHWNKLSTEWQKASFLSGQLRLAGLDVSADRLESDKKKEVGAGGCLSWNAA